MATKQEWVAAKLKENPNYFKELGQKGGKVTGVAKGFASKLQDPVSAGKKSKRGKNVEK